MKKYKIMRENIKGHKAIYHFIDWKAQYLGISSLQNSCVNRVHFQSKVQQVLCRTEAEAKTWRVMKSQALLKKSQVKEPVLQEQK